jgi:hypothetical protein
MAITIQQENDKLLVVRITGLLKKSELDDVQAAAVKQLSFEFVSRINILIIVENFQGWERNADWGDINFYAEHGDKMGKIAIVGDPKQETDLMMFMGAGIRPVPIKFFPLNQLEQARAWLA